jgi:VanZ family protein
MQEHYATYDLQQDHHHDRNRSRLFGYLTLAYTAVVVYASLQPFTGWRMPPDEILRFLIEPPRYFTLNDIVFNFLGYIPFGVLAWLAWRRALGSAPALAAAIVGAALLSLAMESLQMFLPARVSSSLDIVINVAGATVGAGVTALASAPRFTGHALTAIRNRMFLPGAAVDVGIVMVAAWLATHLYAGPQLFDTGDLRDLLQLPTRADYTPQLFILTEAAAVALNTLGIGLLIASLMRDGRHRFSAAIGLIVGGLAIKTVSDAILGETAPFIWATPGAVLGLSAGGLLLYPCLLTRRAVQIWLTAACIVVAVVVINLAPDNPYHAVLPLLIDETHSHYLRLHRIARTLSVSWPFATLTWLAVTGRWQEVH